MHVSTLSLIAVTTLLWLIAPVTSLEFVVSRPAYALGQVAGLAALTLLGWNYVLATRLPWVERIFGGLDKVYVEHKYVGLGAFLLMLLHPVLFVLPAALRSSAATYLPGPAQSLALNLGAIALFTFVLLILLTVAVKLPYHIWKWTHRFMGVPFFFAGVHAFMAGTTISSFLPLKIWLGAIVAIGLGAYLYKLILYRWLAPHFDYVIDSVQTENDVVILEMDPVEKDLPYRPGQYVFVKVKHPELPSETHPFSIASAPGEQMRLAIKELGDYTDQLDVVEPGTIVTLYGPHGQFADRALVDDKDMVWIAGGIGVTPFLSMAPVLVDHPQDIRFYYCTSTAEEAIFNQELARLSGTSLQYLNLVSKRDGRITAERVAQEIDNLTDRLIFLCGPAQMMEDLTQQFVRRGVPRRNIIYEQFALR